MNDNVQELAKQLVVSNDAAFDKLFKLMYNDLVRYAMTFTKDKDKSCSLVQDVFIKLWQIRAQIDTSKSLKAYLFQMVRNKSLNLLRDSRKEVSGLELVDLQDYSYEDDNEESNEHSRELSEKLHEWVERLPDRQREAFELSRFDGLDHDEIAHVMQVSARTVNNHIVAALKQLRVFYDSHLAEKSKLVV
ncbi:MAG: RNA polymerase sigma-70 factor [Bacteroidetes bacterium]|nr:RNA polymerase sigma-70 factor [Bacteroidota bacterium]MCH8523546.1 RNA polymerase sigma-70 factor [Balneolales bacterium]